MPIESHPSFLRPDPSVHLWRYIDLSKFLYLITSGSLWLTNAEVLAIDDPHEVSFSRGQFAHRQWQSIRDVPHEIAQYIAAMYMTEDDDLEAAFARYYKNEEEIGVSILDFRRDCYVNCWHIGDYESVAMWKIYAAPGPGIAVITDFDHLERSLNSNSEISYFGRVQYYDEFKDEIEWSNFLNAVICKRNYFQYEKEARLVHVDNSSKAHGFSLKEWDSDKRRHMITPGPPLRQTGLALACEVGVLIKKVIISPYAPSWYAPMIESLARRLGYRFPIDQSTLLHGPIPNEES